MLEVNPEIHDTLVGQHVIVLATKAFATRAKQNQFVLTLDTAYEVLEHIWGVDPCARVGRRFFIWPDPDREGGHNCNGHDLRIAIGRNDWNNADWFERFFHEMTHGFQFEHPASTMDISGFGEGWAEFMQAVVCDHLACLGAPFDARFARYTVHFPESASAEYLRTKLPIEGIIAYDPSAGLFMELVNTTLDTKGNPDWAPLCKLLQDPLEHPRWVPWHLWPARMARDCMLAFGERKARPILAKYRFPLDLASLDAAEAQNSDVANPRLQRALRSAVGSASEESRIRRNSAPSRIRSRLRTWPGAGASCIRATRFHRLRRSAPRNGVRSRRTSTTRFISTTTAKVRRHFFI